MAFAFLMAILLASTIPPWWGPDEDYHFNYASIISERGSLPDPRKPFYSTEWNRAIVAMNFNQFGMGPPSPTALTGDPHALDKEFARKYGKAARQPTGEPTRPVVHAPLFHISAAVAFIPFHGKSVFTRLWVGRVVNALSALLIVFSAWLLAAQVFTREGPRLLVAALAATQPMVNYATGTMTNDALLYGLFTLSLALLIRILSDPPDIRRGLALGVLVGFALLAKSSALILVPLTLAVFAVQWHQHREARAAVLRSLGACVAACAVLAGWFYVYLLVKYGTLTGAVGAINAPAPGGSRSLTALPGLARAWLQDTYSTYWFHYIYWEGPRGNLVFYVPLLAGLVALTGLVAWFWHQLRGGGRSRPIVRQANFLLVVAVLMILPWFAADMMRGLSGNGFAFNGGRFILPTYGAVAVLFTIAIGELIRRRNHLICFTLLALTTFWVSAEVWKLKVLDRYYGGVGITGIGQELHRATFFHPQWVTKGMLIVVLALIAAAASTALLSGVVAARAALRDGREARH